VDEAEFEVVVTAPEGTSLAAMDEVMRTVEAELRATRGVRLVLTTAGGGFLGTVNTGNAYVRIAPYKERTFSLTRLWYGFVNFDPLAAWRDNYSQRDVIQDIRRRLRKYRDLRTLVRNYPSFNIGGANFEIDLMIRGPELEALVMYGERLREQAPALGIIDANTTLRLNKPELRVQLDRARAADLGVETDDIARALRLMVGGDDKVSRFRDPTLSEDYDVQLRLSEVYRNNPEVISRLYIPRQNGGLVRLGNVVQLVSVQSASRIDRVDRQRTINLRAAIAPGFALADRLEALNTAASALHMPATYTTKAAGRGWELERTFTEFIWAFLLALVFMYMILASQFESLVHPLTILLSLPLSAPFALLSLWYAENTLNLYSALGILLFG
jgi:HAE1 family hydrophobic/amphiphilic exporter-1